MPDSGSRFHFGRGRLTLITDLYGRAALDFLEFSYWFLVGKGRSSVNNPRVLYSLLRTKFRGGSVSEFLELEVVRCWVSGRRIFGVQIGGP